MSKPHKPRSVELGDDVEEAKCACCGRITRRVSGFVHADGDRIRNIFLVYPNHERLSTIKSEGYNLID